MELRMPKNFGVGAAIDHSANAAGSETDRGGCRNFPSVRRYLPLQFIDQAGEFDVASTGGGLIDLDLAEEARIAKFLLENGVERFRQIQHFVHAIFSAASVAQRRQLERRRIGRWIFCR